MENKLLTAEEQFFAIAGEEIATKNLVPGIWTKAWSLALGDDQRALAIYIQLRVEQLQKNQSSARVKSTLKELDWYAKFAIFAVFCVVVVAITGTILEKIFSKPNANLSQKAHTKNDKVIFVIKGSNNIPLNLRPGTKVDVRLIESLPNNRIRTSPILLNAEISDVDTRVVPARVLLSVTPQAADDLTEAQKRGELFLEIASLQSSTK